jgi:hypothetical protein
MARVVETPDGEQLAGAERGPAAEQPPAETADEDLLVERADLGPGAATLVAAGDVIPPELAALPRRSRSSGRAKRRRG